MGTIGKITDGSGATHLLASTAYGTCPTAAATPAKVATIQEEQSFTLFTGVTIHIKFTYANTATSPTLNVNETGAKAIVRYGTTAAGKTANDSWSAGAVVSFTYDGTSWVMNGHITNTNTTYSALALADLNTGTATTDRLITAKVANDGIHQNADIAWDATNKKLTQLDANTAVDKLQFVAGNNITLTGGDGELTIAATDTTYSVANASPTGTDVTAYYPLFHASATGVLAPLSNTSIRYGIISGTTSIKGESRLLLGNSTNSGTNGNQKGFIYLYGETGSKAHIIEGANVTGSSNITHTFQDASGTIAHVEDTTISWDDTNKAIKQGSNTPISQANLQSAIFYIGASAPSNTNVIWLKPVS